MHPERRPELPFFKRCREENNRPFLDEQPMVGSPDRSWHRFRHPLLRKCPFEAEMKFGRVLGYGMDGAVWKVSIGGRIFALKVFWDNTVPESDYYYAIQRECHNGALLQMIQSAVQESDEPIYLHPNPKTWRETVANLQAFSDEGRQRQRFGDMAGAVQYNSTPRIRECFGWTTVNESQLSALPRGGRPPCFTVRNQWRALKEGQDHFAIVYEFIPERAGDALATAADIQPQLDFFWLAGFAFAPEMRTEEWHKFGLFMDMCDLKCPWAVGWSELAHRRFIVGEDKINYSNYSDEEDGEADDS
ncbi:hypothetical protein CONLIGDRAFT_573333 [Coniochaeta ligniaria NRRL 30616]|uniref:Protein kinase domain-containing protein n=1 Tax=Coniochaeta ligniaria NRRL 30616 TaxID=1408157 RepID=A0A1J7IUC2_9PEZI|nr:hypothetical protein CONLIGDRAFT_573333 [Coniochaeta ligniaria NRRL 30616]